VTYHLLEFTHASATPACYVFKMEEFLLYHEDDNYSLGLSQLFLPFPYKVLMFVNSVVVCMIHVLMVVLNLKICICDKWASCTK
jgi:hypothetical protein